ncbi:MAG: aldehyde dehydrogenase family protein [Planctomycetes bacterium]|nr:aldehyde dehydrogenase family protein [Planctomycetota bacterium]
MPAAPAPSIDAILSALRRAARGLGDRPHAERAALALRCGHRVAAVADDWVAASRAAKGWTALAATAAEEWASGPLPVARFLRLLARREQDLARGRPPQPAAAAGSHLDVLPAAGLGDRWLLRGVRARLVYPDPPAPRPTRPAGGVALVLGAGNVTATPLLDALDQILLRGRAVLLKPSPLHAPLRAVFARALAPLVEAGLLHLEDGDAAAGTALAGHPGVDAVHLTGATATAAALRAAPALAGKEFTAELGCCTPAFVLPGAWRPRELRWAATQLAAFTAWNGGATCVAPRVLLTARDWPQRAAFLHEVQRALGALPARAPFHPAARTDYVQAAGAEPPGAELPPVLRQGLDADRDASLLAREHFAPVLLELPVAGATLAAWLAAATAIVRERCFGSLAAYLWAPAHLLAAHQHDVDLARARLPHGTLAENAWAGLGYGLGSAPWGVPATAPWPHGIGWARDLWQAGAVQRVELAAPFGAWPPAPWLPGRRGGAAALRALTHHYADPSPRHLLATAVHACR